jgi:hypothetical protein
MRTVTYNAGAYLVEELLRAGVVGRFIEDGGDIILFDNHVGERISIHLIESAIALYEIRQILQGNEAQHIHTLFILWGDRLLPDEGWQVTADDWLVALYSLYGDRVYAYDIYGNEIFIFPVYFDGVGDTRRVRYGSTVHMGSLGVGTVTTPLGIGRVAGFSLFERRHSARSQHPLAAFFAVLDIESTDDAETVKKAYRLLARRYHPDLNRAADATARMQQINDAYARIMAAFDL